VETGTKRRLHGEAVPFGLRTMAATQELEQELIEEIMDATHRSPPGQLARTDRIRASTAKVRRSRTTWLLLLQELYRCFVALLEKYKYQRWLVCSFLAMLLSMRTSEGVGGGRAVAV
jgi:hypothetical protein